MMMRSEYLLVAFVGSILVGCSSGNSGSSHVVVSDSAGIVMVSNSVAGGWSAEEAPRMVEELRIGSVDGNVESQFGQIIGMDADEEGNVYVLDFQAKELRIFDGEGGFVRTVGRSGSGPGELALPMAVIVAEDQIVIMDLGNRRLQQYDRSGAEAGSVSLGTNIATSGLSRVAYLPSEGHFVEQHRDLSALMAGSLTIPNSMLIRRNKTGEILDTLLVLPADEQMRIADGSRIMATLLAASPVWGVAHGSVLVARSTEMRVEVRSIDGALDRVFTLDSTPVPVSEARKEELTRSLQAIPNIEVEVHPYQPMVLALFEGPEGTIWVQSTQSDDADGQARTEWHIFD